MDDRSHERERMVERQLVRRGIRDERVLAAMGEVPREQFVPSGLTHEAYSDRPLPIGERQTISQPYIVARTAELLAPQPTDRVLDIGTGSGYAAAVLSRIVAEVWSVERIPDLAEAARARLASLDYRNVGVLIGDGRLGWQEHAPFNGIQVAAASDEVPRALEEQLAIGGRMVIPLGDRFSQRLTLIQRVGDQRWRREPGELVRFVPLVRR
jgi:protein-L-isoaspartate(D-aspartate) O-methyltransferase